MAVAAAQKSREMFAINKSYSIEVITAVLTIFPVDCEYKQVLHFLVLCETQKNDSAQ